MLSYTGRHFSGQWHSGPISNPIQARVFPFPTSKFSILHCQNIIGRDYWKYTLSHRIVRFIHLYYMKQLLISALNFPNTKGPWPFLTRWKTPFIPPSQWITLHKLNHIFEWETSFVYKSQEISTRIHRRFM